MNKKDKLILNSKMPISMSLEINNICNAKCSFCAYGKEGSDPREKGSLLEDVFNHSVKLFSEAGGTILDITPTLGEVSVDKRWLELVQRAKEETNISVVRSFTNAINLHKFGIDNILNSGLDVLQLSSSMIDQDMYKRLYGVDKYDQVSENILNISKRNYELGFPVDITLNLRIDLPKQKFFETSFYKELSQYVLRKKITFLEAYDDFNGIVQKSDLPINATFANNQYLIKNSNMPCYQLYRAMQVNYDGVIQGCACRVEPELWTENILNHTSIESAWRNEKLEEIRDGWLTDDKIPECCKTCMHYYPYVNLESYFSIKKSIKSKILIMLKKINIYKYIQYYSLYIQKLKKV